MSNAGATYLDGCTALPRSCRAGQSGAAGGRGGVAQRQALCGPVCRWCSHAPAVGCIIFTKSRSHSAVNRCGSRSMLVRYSQRRRGITTRVQVRCAPTEARTQRTNDAAGMGSTMAPTQPRSTIYNNTSSHHHTHAHTHCAKHARTSAGRTCSKCSSRHVAWQRARCALSSCATPRASWCKLF